MTRFAEGTSVAPEKSEAAIKTLVNKFGADTFASISDSKRAMISFRARGLTIQFTITLPDRNAKAFTVDPRHTWKQRPAAVADKLYEAELRRLWRSLLLVIKAKVESIESGIETMEESFLAQIVVPGGKTAGVVFTQQIELMKSRGSMPQLDSGIR